MRYGVTHMRITKSIVAAFLAIVTACAGDTPTVDIDDLRREADAGPVAARAALLARCPSTFYASLAAPGGWYSTGDSAFTYRGSTPVASACPYGVQTPTMRIATAIPGLTPSCAVVNATTLRCWLPTYQSWWTSSCPASVGLARPTNYRDAATGIVYAVPGSWAFTAPYWGFVAPTVGWAQTVGSGSRMVCDYDGSLKSWIGPQMLVWTP